MLEVDPQVLAEGAEGARMVLRVIADAPVEVTIAADGGPREVRFLEAGKDWVLNGRDHFEIAVTDPGAVRVELDGRPLLDQPFRRRRQLLKAPRWWHRCRV